MPRDTVVWNGCPLTRPRWQRGVGTRLPLALQTTGVPEMAGDAWPDPRKADDLDCASRLGLGARLYTDPPPWANANWGTPILFVGAQVETVTKVCSKCRTVKPLADFWADPRSSDGFRSQCASCDGSYFRERSQGWKTEARSYLAAHSCVDCGEQDIRVLEFDHVRGNGVKHRGVMYLAGRYGWQHEKTQAEVAKCDLRCANCHARRHWKP